MATKIDVIGWQNLYCSAGAAVNEFVNVRQSYSTSSPIIGKLTKSDRWKVQSYGYKTGETDAEKWYAVKMPNGQIGYCRKDLLQFYTQTDKENYTEKELNTFLADLVSVNKSIYLRLLQSSVLLQQASAAGANYNTLAPYIAKLNQLNGQLATRQTELENSTLIKCKTAFDSVWQKAYGAYKKLIETIASVSGIGVAPVVIAAVVVGITAVAGVAAYSIYTALKPKYDASVADLKQSDELKRALESLTPEEKNKVVEDLEKQIDDAYNEGRKDATFSGAWAIIKPLALAVGGWYLISMFIEKQTKKRR